MSDAYDCALANRPLFSTNSLNHISNLYLSIAEESLILGYSGKCGVPPSR